MAVTVMGAIADKINQSPLGQNYPGRYWTGEVPIKDSGGNVIQVGPNSPVIVGEMLSEEPVEWTTETGYVEATKVKFHILGIGYAFVEQVALQLKALFDWRTPPQAINIDNARFYGQQRMNFVVHPDASRSTDVLIVFAGELDYEFRFTKDLNVGSLPGTGQG